MPVTNLKPYCILDSMNSDQKVGILDAGNNLLDTCFRQSLGIESMLPFPRDGDSLQWMQSLQALELQGWPWLYPKVQMQKCDKCTLEFCSSINYRRHVRVHRRSLNIDKDFPKNRDCLREFWDKLSRDEAKEILSFHNIALEGISGLSVLEKLATLIFTTGLALLPKAYARAGLALLDVVQAGPSVFPISSEMLFSILDEASEKTFLCAGTAISLQKFVFDGEIGKVGLEMKNVIAFTCFLLEQQLIKAWIADKDAEALRCQKLLMEEEETAQRRQAKLYEKRRLRKRRQMEQQKAKKQIGCEKADSGENSSEIDREETSSEHIDREEADSGENSSEQIDREETSSEPIDREEADFGKNPSDSVIVLPSIETSGSQAASNKNFHAHEDSSEAVVRQNLDTGRELDSGFLSGSSDLHLDTAPGNVDSNNSRNVYLPVKKRNTFRQVQPTPYHSQHGVSNGFRSSGFSKQGSVHRQFVHWEQKHPVVNSHKIWTPKIMPQNKSGNASVEVSRASTDFSARELRDQPDLNKCDVLIGSIPVTLQEGDGHSHCPKLPSPVDQCAAEKQSIPTKDAKEKYTKPDSGQFGNRNQSVKLWRSVNKHEVPVKDGVRERERDSTGIMNIRVTDQASTEENCLPSVDSSAVVEARADPKGPRSLASVDSSAVVEARADPKGPRRLPFFCARSAEAFLIQRWKVAISGEHVMLVLSPETKPSNDPYHQNNAAVPGTFNPDILCSRENRLLSSVEPLEPVKRQPVKQRGPKSRAPKR